MRSGGTSARRFGGRSASCEADCSSCSAGRPNFSKEGHLTLLSVYASDERLNTWVTRWENFLESVRRERDDVRIIYVTPDQAEGDDKRFHLLRSV